MRIMVIGRIRSHIERLYGFELPIPDINDFITPTDEPLSHVRVLPVENDLLVSIYLSADVMQWVEQAQREGGALRVADFGPYQEAMEEVSHFCYIAWHCGERNTDPSALSHFELELQKQVDAYLLTAEHTLRQGHGVRDLRHHIFDRPVSEEHPEQMQEIYRHTAGYAHSYCAYLERMLACADRRDFLDEVRSFYNKGQVGKVHHIMDRAQR